MRLSMDWRNRGRQHPLRHGASIVALAVTLVLGPGGPARSADAPGVSIELNKLENQGKACRATIVVDNTTANPFQALKLDLVFFRPDGVMDRRLAVDLAPLRATKKMIKIFDLDSLSCDGIGTVLVNDVIECRDAAGPVADCFDRLTFSARGTVTLSK